ncbi:hypothetical protein KAS50_08610, partial [bacterium]|nr:hypothetical protein [bacterium]
IPKKHYKHNHIVYLPCYVDHQDNLFALSEDEIIDNYLESLISIFPEFNKDWIREISLFKDLYATPVYSLNYSKNKPSFKTPISHLYLVNTSQVYPEDRNMNNCIKNARQVLKELEMT